MPEPPRMTIPPSERTPIPDGAEPRRIRHERTHPGGCGADLTEFCTYFDLPVANAPGGQLTVIIVPCICPACGGAMIYDVPATPPPPRIAIPRGARIPRQ